MILLWFVVRDFELVCFVRFVFAFGCIVSLFVWMYAFGYVIGICDFDLGFDSVVTFFIEVFLIWFWLLLLLCGWWVFVWFLILFGWYFDVCCLLCYGFGFDVIVLNC